MAARQSRGAVLLLSLALFFAAVTEGRLLGSGLVHRVHELVESLDDFVSEEQTSLITPESLGSFKKEYAGPIKNDKPLIGILSQPCTLCPGLSYVSASYVKWIEAAGGRAVPIKFYDSDEELARLFKSVNGLIFAGGLTWLWLDSPYVIAARKLYNMAVDANEAGDIFPIHGTCLGHQLLQILASNVSRNDLLVDTDSVSHPTTLRFRPAAKNSTYFGTMRADLLADLEDERQNIALENHMYGVPPAHYDKWPILKETYDILSTTLDRNGVEYVSTIEGRRWPFFGTQWHPEKPPNEFADLTIPHSFEAIRASQHLANRFVEIARRSGHKAESHEQELAMQIYSIAPIFTARFEDVTEKSYDGPDLTYFLDVEDKPTNEASPKGPFPSDGGKAENATLAEYQQTYGLVRSMSSFS